MLAPRDALLVGLGALAYPLGLLIGRLIAGRDVLDPAHTRHKEA